MNGRIFLFRDLTYCSIFTFADETVTLIGEIKEEITNDGIRRTPIVTIHGNDEPICPYCLCSHKTQHVNQIVYPKCDKVRRKAVVKDESGIEYTAEKDGYYVKQL